MKQIIAMTMMMALLLTGCGKKKDVTPNVPSTDNNTVTKDVEDGMNNAGEKVQDGVDKAGDAVENGMDKAGTAVENGMEKAGDALEGDTANTNDMQNSTTNQSTN